MVEIPGPVLAALLVGVAAYYGAVGVVKGFKAIAHKADAAIHHVLHPHATSPEAK